MRRDIRGLVVRIPEKFAYTALHLAVAGTVACSSSGETAAADASTDSARHDSAADVAQDSVFIPDGAIDDSATADGSCTNPPYYCGPSGTIDGAVCPGPVCDLSQCPAGCEPFV